MKSGPLPPQFDPSEEVLGLIKLLHDTGQRLEELTAGEVDAVADHQGRTFLLRRTQQELRDREAARQTAILNAMPAHVALLDPQGAIILVNDAWRRFASANALQGPLNAIGVNYLAVCDAAKGACSDEAHPVAKGIRSVLTGATKSFSIEYPCHSPTERRWFMMTATPLAEDRPNGVVIMHMSVTAERLSELNLHAQELRFTALVENVADGICHTQPNGVLMYVSPSMKAIGGYEIDEMIGHNLFEFMHPDDIPLGIKALSEINRTPGTPVVTELRFRHKNGSWQTLESITKDLSLLPDIGGLVVNVRNVTERNRAIMDLAQSQKRLDGIITSAMDAIVTIDKNGHIVLTNPAADAVFGYAVGELIGQSLDVIIPQRSRADHSAYVEAFGKSGVTSRRMGALRNVFGLRKNGEEFPIEASISKDDSTGRQSFTAILRDITERTKADARIIYLNRVYAVLSATNSMIVHVSDREELFKEACRIAVETGGFAMALIGIVDPESKVIVPVASAGKDAELLAAIKTLTATRELASTTMVARAVRDMRAVVANDSEHDPQVLLGNKYSDAGVRSIAIFPLIVSGEAVGAFGLYAKDEGFFGEDELKLLTEMSTDIAFAIDHLEKQARLNYLAYYDVLTGLANQSFFLERVAQYIRSAKSGGHKLAVFLVDLERFKNINDSLGQAAGDALLKMVALWLTNNAGDANLVARINADHFALVLPRVQQEGDVIRLVEKTMGAFLDHPFHLNDAVFRVAAKAGVAIFPEDGATADTLFRNAEAALKQAKAHGDRYLFHTRKMTEKVAGRLTLENQLRQAVQQQEFALYYQPKVNMVSSELAGAEALIRWNNPRTGPVPPSRFIPILEETGLIHQVGQWALRKASEDYLRWRAAGLAVVRISVNVSPLQLRNRNFASEIQQVVGGHAHAAAGLELEITENLIMEDIKRSIASLQAIRAMGVTIAIDDFGTGFSSLSYLSKLPIDTLKIDRSFVTDMTATSEGLSLVSTIINLAHSLKLKVVAEGVENDEQSRLLRLLDCDQMQGFLFSEAVPSEIFETRFLVPHTNT